MESKDKFRRSYNYLKNRYRILQVEKINEIESILFFDYVGAIVIARQEKINAPLHTFELHPYKLYLAHKIYWILLLNIKKIKIKTGVNKNKPNTFISILIKFWWVFIVPLSVIIIGFLIEKGIINLGI